MLFEPQAHVGYFIGQKRWRMTDSSDIDELLPASFSAVTHS